MEFEEINVLDKKTIKKIKEAGYKDVESLKELDINKLAELGIKEKPAKEIIEKLEKLKEPATEPVKDEFDLEKENKYLVAGFKATKDYNEKLKGKELKSAFEKFKGEK